MGRRVGPPGLHQDSPSPIPESSRAREVVWTIATNSRDEIGDELFVARDIAHDDGGLADALKGRKGSTYLAGLDAKAADFDLVVSAAQKIEHAVRTPASKIARAVHARARRAKRAGDEALGGEARPAQIPARQACARDVELARYSDGRAGLEHPYQRERQDPGDLDVGFADRLQYCARIQLCNHRLPRGRGMSAST